MASVIKWPESSANFKRALHEKRARMLKQKMLQAKKPSTDKPANKSTRQWLANPDYRFGSHFEAEPTTGRNRAQPGQYSKPDKALF